MTGFIRATILQRVLVDLTVFHDQAHGFDATCFTIRGIKQFRVAANHGDVLQGIAVHQQDVGIGAFLNHSGQIEQHRK